MIHRNSLLTAEMATVLVTSGLKIAYNSKPDVTYKIRHTMSAADIIKTQSGSSTRCYPNKMITTKAKVFGGGPNKVG